MKYVAFFPLLLLGCAKNDSPAPASASTLTPAEQQLVGKWNLLSIVNSTKYTSGAPTQVSPSNFQGSKNYLQFNGDGTWHELIGFDYDGTFTYQPPVLKYSVGRAYTVTKLTANDLVMSFTDSVMYQGHTRYYNIQVRTYGK